MPVLVKECVEREERDMSTDMKRTPERKKNQGTMRNGKTNGFSGKNEFLDRNLKIRNLS